MNNHSCARCGQCCYIFDIINQVQTSIPCENLVKLPDGTTKCRVYHRNRVGRRIGPKEYNNRCILRENSKFDYPGCSLNSNKPMIESVR